MKIKKDFKLTRRYGEDTLIPIGESLESFKGIIKVNNIGSYIWGNLEQVNSEEEMISMIVDNCGLELNEAQKDVKEFLTYLKNVDII